MYNGRTKISPLDSLGEGYEASLQWTNLDSGTKVSLTTRLFLRKKRDPRKDNRMDFNRKHQIIQSL